MAPPKGFVPWNKGLKKDSDPRVAATSEKNSGQKRNEFQRTRISKATKAARQRIWNRNPDRQAQKLKEKLIKRMRSMIERTIVQLGTKKQGHTHEQLGYTPLEFKEHIEKLFKPGMTWDNHGKGAGKWHVDHIKRMASFPPGTPANVVNALSNLQPLWQEENLMKG